MDIYAQFKFSERVRTMTDKDLKKLTRMELLELLLEQTKENEQLRSELAEAKTALEDKNILIENAGSIARAALELNGVFEAAQAAADQYLQNIKRISVEK